MSGQQQPQPEWRTRRPQPEWRTGRPQSQPQSQSQPQPQPNPSPKQKTKQPSSEDHKRYGFDSQSQQKQSPLQPKQSPKRSPKQQKQSSSKGYEKYGFGTYFQKQTYTPSSADTGSWRTGPKINKNISPWAAHASKQLEVGGKGVNNDLIEKILEDIKKNDKRKPNDPKFMYPSMQQFIRKIGRKIYSSETSSNFFSGANKRLIETNTEHIIPRSIVAELRNEDPRSSKDPYYPPDPYNIRISPKFINKYRDIARFGIVNNPTLIFDGFGKPVYVNDEKYNFDNVQPAKYVDKDSIKNYKTDRYTWIDNSPIRIEKIPVEKNEPEETLGKKNKFREVTICDSINCVVEPINNEKGMIARSFFYILLVYIYPNIAKLGTKKLTQYSFVSGTNFSNIVNDENILLYAKWNEEYPPDKQEIKETLVISSLLGYLNPFVMYYDEKNRKYVFNRKLPSILFVDGESSPQNLFDMCTTKSPFINLIDTISIDNYMNETTVVPITNYQFNATYPNNSDPILTIYSYTNPQNPNPQKPNTKPQNPNPNITGGYYQKKYQKYKEKYLLLKKYYQLNQHSKFNI